MSASAKSQRKKTNRKPDQFSFLFKNNPLPMWIYDRETLRFLDVNEAAAKHYGYSRAEFLHMRLADIRPEEDVEPLKAYLRSSRKRLRYSGERRHIKKDGTLIYVDINSHKIVYKGRKAVLTVAKDITESKQARSALNESQAELMDVVNSAMDAIIMVDNNQRIVLFNPSAEKMFQRSAPEVIGKPLNLLLPRRFRTVHKTHVSKFGKTGTTTRSAADLGRLIGLRADGTEFPIEISISTTRTSGKKLYTAIVRDVSERVRSEETLRESEERFCSLFENTTIGIYRTTPDGQILMSNPALVKMLGYNSFEELAKRNLEKDGNNAEYERKDFKEQIEREGIIRGRETAWKTKSENVIYVRESAQVIRDNHGKVLYYEGTIEDISDRKKAEEQTQRQLIELQALYESGLAFGHTMDVRAIGEQIIHVLEKHLYWHHAIVRLRREDSDELDLVAFSEGKDTSVPSVKRALVKISRTGQGIAGWVVEQGKTVRVGNLTKDNRHIKTFANMKSGLYVPLKVGKTAIGVISVESEKVDAFDENDERLLTTLAAQAAAAVQNARLFHHAQRRSLEAETLYQVTAELAIQNDISSLLKTIANDIAMLASVPGGAVYLYDAQQDVSEVAATTDANLPIGTRIQSDTGMIGQIVRSRKPMIINDYKAWEEAAPQYKNQPFYSVLGVPMLYSGELIGILVAHGLHATRTTKEDNRQFTDQDMRLLSLFASAAAGAVYSARLLESERKRRQEAETLQKAATALTSSLNVDQILNALLDGLGQVIAFNTSTVFTSDGKNIRSVAERGNPKTFINRSFPIEDSMEKYVFELRAPVIIADVRADSRFHLLDESVVIRSWIGLPLIAHDQVIGSLAMSSEQPNAFTQAHAEIAMAIANQAATAIENARLFQDAVRYAQRWATLHAVSQELARVSDNLEQVYTSIHNAAEKLMSAEVFTITLLDEKRNQIDGVYLYDRAGRSPVLHLP
ncbi:MAG TPA: PAS domain S-box protein, partial [Anaerolineales bacterium]